MRFDANVPTRDISKTLGRPAFGGPENFVRFATERRIGTPREEPICVQNRKKYPWSQPGTQLSQCPLLQSGSFPDESRQARLDIGKFLNELLQRLCKKRRPGSSTHSCFIACPMPSNTTHNSTPCRIKSLAHVWTIASNAAACPPNTPSRSLASYRRCNQGGVSSIPIKNGSYHSDVHNFCPRMANKLCVQPLFRHLSGRITLFPSTISTPHFAPTAAKSTWLPQGTLAAVICSQK